MAQNPAPSTLLGAIVVAAALLIGAALVYTSLDRVAEELGEMRAALAQLEERVKASAAAPAAARRAARSGRPDPNRRYSVDTSASPALGDPDAKVTLVEFSDFQCPYCARVRPTLEKVAEEYEGDVRIVFKHLPLRIHPKAPAAHRAAEAARRQGKFWEMHDLIFENQAQMSEAKYVEYAAQLGLDVDQFSKDVASPEVKQRVDADAREAAKLGVSGTPAFFINGKYLSGALPFDTFRRAIDQALEQG